jgi:hypothetical protein
MDSFETTLEPVRTSHFAAGEHDKLFSLKEGGRERDFTKNVFFSLARSLSGASLQGCLNNTFINIY